MALTANVEIESSGANPYLSTATAYQHLTEDYSIDIRASRGRTGREGPRLK